MSTQTKKGHRWSKSECAQGRSFQLAMLANAIPLIELMSVIEKFDHEFFRSAVPVANEFLVPASRVLSLNLSAKARKSQKMSVDQVNGLIREVHAAAKRWNQFITSPSSLQSAKRVSERMRDRREQARTKRTEFDALNKFMNGRN